MIRSPATKEISGRNVIVMEFPLDRPGSLEPREATMVLLRVLVIGLASCALMAACVALGQRSQDPDERKQIEKQMAAGNFKDAYEGYRKLALDAKTDPAAAGTDLAKALECLEQLGRSKEMDPFREAVIAVHHKSWRLLQAAAESYLNDSQHFGYIVAGKFERGQDREGGRFVGSYERDRARAIQLLLQGLDQARRDPDRPAAGRYLMTFARAVLGNRDVDESWRLQTLTTLDPLPDYSEYAYTVWGQQRSGAPVEADGSPVYYKVPESFATARSDGQRWRWALQEAALADPGQQNAARFALATFFNQEFGTQTMATFGIGRSPESDEPESTGPYAVNTLKDDETIARLASGIKRFKLPDEFNPIKILQAISVDPKTASGEDALDLLATIFVNRRQLDRAAAYLKQDKERYGDKEGTKQQQLDQILGGWGVFEAMSTQPAGRGASVHFRFRNGRHVQFEAQEIDFARVLNDVKQYFSSKPAQLDWSKINVDDVGTRLVAMNEQQYLGRQVARWDLDLDPMPDHLDKRLTVTTPLQKAGAYLLTAKIEGGNTSRIVVWLDDTVILRKRLANANYYFVADARTGQPVGVADIELFGWRMLPSERPNQARFETKRLVAKTDETGQLVAPFTDAQEDQASFQWLVTATTPGQRLAHLGFANFWPLSGRHPAFDQTKVFMITDRPVYRPGAPVRFKFWVGRARYDQPPASEFAGQPFAVEITNPKGEKLLTKTFTADGFGGFDGSIELASDAMLGVYQVQIPKRGGGSFRVEEYKKPEFEVNVEAPSKPVMLGEKVPATIKASYYFGGPVVQAKVKYKITRTPADARWYPRARWDWLFGSGYWWFAVDSSWYPGWSRWGMLRPIAAWWGHSESPPEVVAEAEMPIGADGTLKVEFDTGLARAAHPNDDQRYVITAEITDQSRRTIVGTGTVLVARKPFSVYTWVDRGHYRAGDTIEAELRAQTLDHKPVPGKGTLKLLKIAYDGEGRPVETPVETWDLALGADGQASRKIKAAAAGQYRLSATIDDGQGHTVEGGYLLTITGAGWNSAAFRYSDLEIIPDRKEYRPGESIKLLINTNQANAAVLLFVRPVNSVYLPPQLVHIRGKSAVAEIGIVHQDMPNIFVEALTVVDGKVHDQVREIVVPPESRVVDLAIEPSKTIFKPGEKARIKLKATNPDGKPFAGSMVVAVYDKAVEYISGGSNVPEIKAYFWSWKRNHGPQTTSNLDLSFFNLLKNGEVGMADLGVFGGLATFDEDPPGGVRLGRGGMMGGFGGMGGGGGRGGPMMRAMSRGPAAAAPMAMANAAGAELESTLAKSKAGGAGEDQRELSAILVPGGDAQSVEPTIRTNFADTAYWVAALNSGADGIAETEFPLPESLTTWKVKTWAMGPGTKVGESESELVTSKDLLVRLQSPRFFVEKDEVMLSANVHNKLKNAKKVQVILELDGSVLEPLGETAQSVEIAAGGEHRVDWRVKVVHEGQAVIRMKALTDEESDAAQMSFPAYVHGMLKFAAFAGAIRSDEEKAEIAFHVPADRRPDQTRLEVRYSPTLAGALVDALPYLADYPYGCTEQTLNRFLPTVLTQKVLINLGLDLKAIREQHTNLNAQELGDPRDRARSRQGYPHNPVFDPAEVARMASAGITRLADMQLSDGGWGWFSGFGEFPSPHTTAVVVHGLQIARQNDLALPQQMLERGVAWLTTYQAKQVGLLENAVSQVKPAKASADDIDALIFMILADADVRNDRMLGFLDRDRTRLSVYAKAMFGLGLERFGEKEKLAVVLQNLNQYVVEDNENQTAYLKLPNRGYWWSWYGSEIESDASYIKLLSRTDPKGKLASRLVKYVLNNRKHGTYWNSTRDTAYCIEALAEYLKASGEDRPNQTITIALDGQTRKEVKITPDLLFRFDNAFVLEGKALETGKHTVSFLKSGTGPLYFNAYVTNFTLEDPITRTGLEIKVDRKVYRLIRDDTTKDVAGGRGQAISQRAERFRRELLADHAELKSGELVEVELEIDSKNDYEYLIFEDFKPAGFEPVEIRSGYNGNDLGAYVEFRDERVAFFARTLNRGKHSVSYRLRAEIPGRFHALPARAQAMYAPELRANSDEIRLQVKD
jgi:alpha-2-macroglobulin